MPLNSCAKLTLILGWGLAGAGGAHTSPAVTLAAVARQDSGDIPLEIIEVQSGSYLDEDDIIRIEDDYGRNME